MDITHQLEDLSHRLVKDGNINSSRIVDLGVREIVELREELEDLSREIGKLGELIE